MMRRKHGENVWFVWLKLLSAAAAYWTVAVCFGDEPAIDVSSVSGTVIYHSPAASRIYVGSPGIARLSNGDYLAKCDDFGPGSSEDTLGVTRVFRSLDRGATWKQLPPVR